MSPAALSRRRLLQAAGIALAGTAAGQALGAREAGAAAEIGVSAHPFRPGQVRLSAGRWLDGQNRTLAYLRFLDADRLLHTFRLNAGIASSARPCGGWEAPGVELRGHTTGHVLSALAQAYAITGDPAYQSKGAYLVDALAACQAAAPGRGFHAGYLSAFPEGFFDRLESGQGGWAPWYTLHKIMAGLLDQHVLAGNSRARTVAVALAGWVDRRTGRLGGQRMQSVLDTEFGGMGAVLTDLYLRTGDARWSGVARRFDHAAAFDPLAAGQDRLDGLHARAQVPKWIGAARAYQATGVTRYRDIAVNAWNIAVGAHTYVIGGTGQAERFGPPGAVAGHLTGDVCESCTTHNLLKLTRELFTLHPDRAELFDYYERALLNQLIGQQNPADDHGHVCHFTPLHPGARRTYGTDYDTFTCCQGTGLETHTGLADSIYFHRGTTLIVNLFTPSVLDWTERGITVTQTTAYPASDTTTLRVTGNVAGSWSMRIRIPAWAAGATVGVNGTRQRVATDPGGYAILTRAWADGDTVTVRLPMQVTVRAAGDDPNLAAITYGPVVLAGDYGDTALGAVPGLATTSVIRTGSTTLAFTATANGAPVRLIPFYDAHGVNYNVYWNIGGGGGLPGGWARIGNAVTGLVLDGGGEVAPGSVLKQWDWDGSTNLQWQPVDLGGGWYRIVNRTNGLVLDSRGDTAAGAVCRQAAWHGGDDQQWWLNSVGGGRYQIINRGTGTALDGMGGTSAGAAVVLRPPNSGAGDRWTITAA
ncbi:hypothetical protein Sru01_49610 [Sphaerisporangium rufum]|uniref:Ricin B lectin domain-containing protein n=1 Tax=Sphaerisporangium rufum TaxID=1381558 RepID=A0A919V1Q4_9ACTN|nr:beta-L-arabinofuranosidase domain-containing protein [Sphaerisporangium rufum]GII79979.1 hypothetical protein Sru01_49610 [Sphaerisporangium rufum]